MLEEVYNVAIYPLEAEMVPANRQPDSDRTVRTFSFQLLAKAIKTLRSIRVVVLEGCGEDGMSLARALLETVFAVFWILQRDSPVRVRKYLAHEAKRDLVRVQQLCQTPGYEEIGHEQLVECSDSNRGVSEVPGMAVLDGSDENREVVVTNINLWSTVQRTSVTCRLPHGTAVQIHEAQRKDAEDRHYFRVEADGCAGWVPESFVVTQ